MHEAAPPFLGYESCWASQWPAGRLAGRMQNGLRSEHYILHMTGAWLSGHSFCDSDRLIEARENRLLLQRRVQRPRVSRGTGSQGDAHHAT